MQIHNWTGKIFSLLCTLYFGSSALAAEYDSLSKCRVAFYTLSPSGVIAEADAYCKPKMDPVVFCTDQAVLAEQQRAGIPYSTVQITTANQKYRAQCVASGGVSVSSPVAGAAPANSYGLVPPTQPDYTSCNGNPTCIQVKQQSYQTAQQRYQADLQAAQANAEKQAAASKPTAAQQQQQQQQNTQMALQLAQIGAGAAAAGGGSNRPVEAVAPAPSYAEPQAAGGSVPSMSDVKKDTGELGQTAMVDPETSMIAAKKAAGELGSAGEEVKSIGGMSKEAGAIESAPAKASDVGVTAGPITDEAKAAMSQFQAELEKAAVAAIGKLPLPYFSMTKTAWETAAKTIVTEYETQKKLCATDAERTEMLCVEGTSPGAKAARALMDASGPILMAINSAQKACSSTGKVTNLAGIGMTIANGVCIASKMKCEGTCAAANAELEKAKAQQLAALQNAFNMEKGKCIADTTCKGLLPPAVAGQQSAVAALNTAVTKEKKPSPGTASGLMAKCESKIRNIIGMLTNIGALALAKKGANECEKQLATSGAAGAAVTSQQYCEVPANKTTQHCKCQTDNTKEGCPGYLVANAPTDPKKDAAGMNIKPNSGMSNFAGGRANGNGSNSDYGVKAGGGSESGDNGPFVPGSATGSAGGGAVGGGGGGAGSGSANVQGVDGGSGKEAKDDKKWSFGSFAAGVGSMMGGGKGGSGGAGNGNLNSQQEAAIERKIASDRYAAEVTPASGISNWDKVHKTVIRVEGSLMPSGK